MKLNQGNLGPSSGSTIMQIEHAGDVDFPTGTGYLGLPRGTSAQQPGSPTEGMIRGNTDNNEPEYYTGTAWKSIPLYEEGTFTPTLSFAGNNVGIAYSKQVGMYARVGKLVWINFELVLTSKGSSTGLAEVEGFPGFINVNAESECTIKYQNLSFSGTQLVGIFAYVPFKRFLIQNLSSSSGAINLTNTAFANNSSLDSTFVIKIL
jgi:hypothetical protein